MAGCTAIVALLPPLAISRARLARYAALATGIALALFAARVYLASSQRDLLDPKFALLSSEALLVAGSLDVAPYLPHLASATTPGVAADGPRQRLPYQLAAHDGRLLYIFPPGTVLLDVPGMWVARQLGFSTLTPHGRYSSAQERRLQALFAAAVAALTVVVVHRIARRELSLPAAAAVALAAAFASELWGTASRLLWTHTWATFWVAVAWLELLRWEDGERRRPLWLAVALGAAVWCRPTTVLVVLPATLYVALRHRPALLRVLVGGAFAALGLLAFNLFVWNSWTSKYDAVHAPLLGFWPPAGSLLARAVRPLLSPEHGLVVLYPVLLVVVLALAVHGISSERRALAALAVVGVLAHLAFYARFQRFWGGGTAGNRFLTEVAPLFAWLGAHAWRQTREAWRARPPARLVRLAVAAATALLVVAGTAAQAAGSIQLSWRRTERARRAAGIELGAKPSRPAGYWMRTPQAKLVVWVARERWPRAGAVPPRRAPR